MKTDKGKEGKFSFSVANSEGKSTEYWKNFMEKFFKDNGAKMSNSKMRKKEKVSNF